SVSNNPSLENATLKITALAGGVGAARFLTGLAFRAFLFYLMQAEARKQSTKIVLSLELVYHQ
ncbi:MAG TPA: hypothetical protein V6C97_27995, partial [Oculatellaceae cyanobacterium]